MLFYGTASDVTSSGKRNLCAFILSEKCSKQIVGTSHLTHVLVVDNKAAHRTHDLNCVSVNSVNYSAHITDGIKEDIYIPDIGKILDGNHFIRHNGCSYNTEGCIFSAVNYDISGKGFPAPNNIFAHLCTGIMPFCKGISFHFTIYF